MTRLRPPDAAESADSSRAPDRSKLLDEYWDAIRCDSATEVRRRLVLWEQPDASIGEDLDVLDRLHEARSVPGADVVASRSPNAWLSDSFANGAVTPATDNRADAAPPGTQGRSALEEPKRIGKYSVVEMLDSGGQGQVFRVIHPGLGRTVILKLARRPVASGEQAGRDALEREGRLLDRCEHPNLVRVIDVDIHEGRRFVVMEDVAGVNLQQFAARQRPAPREAVRLVIELARAVAYLHEKGITHQDIKPQNVLVDDRGRPRLIDLGLARWNRAWCDDGDDWIGGTASYMSPEQAMGRGDLVGPRTDVFGLGAVLYHLLTGRALYVGSSPAAVQRFAREARYATFRQLKRRVPRSLRRICHKALAADPEQRYGTAFELERALRRHTARRWMAALGLLLLVSCTVAAVFVLRLGPRRVASEPTRHAFARSWEGEPQHHPARMEPRPPGITQGHLGLASGSVLPAPSALKVMTLVGEHYRKRDSGEEESFGRIDYSDRPIREGDGVTVFGELDAPAYCYVIALTPDGKNQLYWPREESDWPSLSLRIGTSEWGFPLTDGAGWQAFVVLASRKPLPPFRDWNGRDGLAKRWKQVSADDVDGVWEYRDGELTRASGALRGPLEKRAISRPEPVRDVCEYLAKLPGVEAVRALAFPVRPKKQFR